MLRLNLSGQGVLVDLPQSSDKLVPAGIRHHIQPLLYKVNFLHVTTVPLSDIIHILEWYTDLEHQVPCFLQRQLVDCIAHFECFIGGCHFSMQWYSAKRQIIFNVDRANRLAPFGRLQNIHMSSQTSPATHTCIIRLYEVL